MVKRVCFLLLVACLAVALPAVAEEQELNCYGEALLGARGVGFLNLCTGIGRLCWGCSDSPRVL